MFTYIWELRSKPSELCTIASIDYPDYVRWQHL